MADCEYFSSEEIRDELLGSIGEIVPDNAYRGEYKPLGNSTEVDAGELDVNIYAIDGLVRRSAPLQESALGRASVSTDLDEAQLA